MRFSYPKRHLFPTLPPQWAPWEDLFRADRPHYRLKLSYKLDLGPWATTGLCRLSLPSIFRRTLLSSRPLRPLLWPRKRRSLRPTPRH